MFCAKQYQSLLLTKLLSLSHNIQNVSKSTCERHQYSEIDFLYYILLLYSLYTPSFILTMFTLLVFLIIIFVQQFIT